MYALYWKELYIAKEPMRKNCTLQTWRGKQIAICEEEEPLKRIIASSKEKDKNRYYIEKLAF